MSKEIKWVDIHERLPEKYAKVLTLLFRSGRGYDLQMNSVQDRNIQNADGSITETFQWLEGNQRVEYWLEGLPKLPQEPQENEV